MYVCIYYVFTYIFVYFHIVLRKILFVIRFDSSTIRYHLAAIISFTEIIQLIAHTHHRKEVMMERRSGLPKVK